MVTRSKVQQLVGIAAEAAPLAVVGDLLVRGGAQVSLDALFAEHVDAFRAAQDDPSLSTPSAEEFAAVFSLLELATVVELMAGLADGHLEDVVQADLGNGGQRQANVLEAGGAMVLKLRD